VENNREETKRPPCTVLTCKSKANGKKCRDELNGKSNKRYDAR